MRTRTAVFATFCIIAALSAQGQCITDTGTLLTSGCDTDVKKNTATQVLLRVWNTGAGGAKQRFVAADGSEARYQITHHSSWSAELVGKNNLADPNNNVLQFRVRGAADANSEAGLAAANKMTILGNGNVGIGTIPTTDSGYKLRVGGHMHVDGTLTGTNIVANYQDIAEWVPATADLTPGTVVVLNTEADNQVMASHEPYDTRVAGVVSAQPGITLGVGGAGQEKIATTGRVLVNVDATKAPIRVGDLLVTGDAPGVAMRSEPMEIRGRTFHQPGTIIGKALQPLESGRGSILVLLSMQ